MQNPNIYGILKTIKDREQVALLIIISLHCWNLTFKQVYYLLLYCTLLIYLACGSYILLQFIKSQTLSTTCDAPRTIALLFTMSMHFFTANILQLSMLENAVSFQQS